VKLLEFFFLIVHRIQLLVLDLVSYLVVVVVVAVVVVVVVVAVVVEEHNRNDMDNQNDCDQYYLVTIIENGGYGGA
jgi:hypothetical protein